MSTGRLKGGELMIRWTKLVVGHPFDTIKVSFSI